MGTISQNLASNRRRTYLILLVSFYIFIFMHPVLAQTKTNANVVREFEAHRSILESEIKAVAKAPAPLAKERCEENYGFLPCTDGIWGNLFLLAIYGFLMLKAAQLLSEGSEMLLTVLSPGIIGGLLLPILGALPDALLILVSGMAASAENAQAEILVGMGLLAGSTVMLLTLLWGSSLLVGRCDFQNGKAKDRTLTRKFDIFNTGVSTDPQTRVAAWIMIATVIPYLIAQIPHTFHKRRLGHIFAIISCAWAFIGLLVYCSYQIFSPWIQERRIYFAKEHLRRTHILHRVSEYSHEEFGSLLLEDRRTPNTATFAKIFEAFDKDKDGALSISELKSLVLSLGVCTQTNVPEDDEIQAWLRDFDISNDGLIQKQEFINGMSKWVKAVLMRSKGKLNRYPTLVHKPDFWHSRSEEAEHNLNILLDADSDDNKEEDEEDEEKKPKEPPTKRAVITKASLLILCGAVVAGIFSDPLVDSITNFSTASKIPPFFVAFIATPLATNSSEAISSLMFAARKKKKNTSITYSQIYGAVALNNTLCLGIFLAVVVVRHLDWNFSSEVTTIAIVTIIMGAIGGSRTSFPVWIGLIALALYPLSIGMVVIFDYVLHWT